MLIDTNKSIELIWQILWNLNNRVEELEAANGYMSGTNDTAICLLKELELLCSKHEETLDTNDWDAPKPMQPKTLDGEN